MQLLVVTAAADQTGRTISLLVAGLVGIAVALMALTVWYWRHSDPKRRARSRSKPEPQPVELVDPRQDRVDLVDHVDRADDDELVRSVPHRAPVGVARRVVASTPPSATSLLPPSSPPGPDREVDGVVDTVADESRQWVDPDVWVDAFALGPDKAAAPPEPAGPPTVFPPIPPTPSVDPGSSPDELRPGGHSLSDADWDAITRAAFARFAETESPGSVGIADQSPVR